MHGLKLIGLALLTPFLALGQNEVNIKIGQRTLFFQDMLRNRPLTTEIWYPTTDSLPKNSPPNYSPFIREVSIRDAALSAGKHPLILLSHGTGGNRFGQEWLADALVKKGFVVAAVDHWGNTMDHPIAIDFVTPWERPRDISYVLSCLLADPAWSNSIDKDKIGAAGFSIGGYTVIALAGGKVSLTALNSYFKTAAGQKELAIPEFPNLISQVNQQEITASFENCPDVKDARIKAFFAMSPAIGQGFTQKTQFKDLHAPLYIIAAESDSIAPAKTNARHYHQLIHGSSLMVIKGKAGHYIFLNEAGEIVKKQAPAYFTDQHGVDRNLIHQQVAEQAAQFFASALGYLK